MVDSRQLLFDPTDFLGLVWKRHLHKLVGNIVQLYFLYLYDLKKNLFPANVQNIYSVTEEVNSKLVRYNWPE